jgi:hypothetical protein
MLWEGFSDGTGSWVLRALGPRGPVCAVTIFKGKHDSAWWFVQFLKHLHSRVGQRSTLLVINKNGSNGKEVKIE